MPIVTCCLIDCQTLPFTGCVFFFFFPKDLLLSQGLRAGAEFEKFSFPGLCCGTGSPFDSCTFEHLTCCLAFPRAWCRCLHVAEVRALQPRSLRHEPALLQIINQHCPCPGRAYNVVGEGRETSKARNWQPTGRAWPTELLSLCCVLNSD